MKNINEEIPKQALWANKPNRLFDTCLTDYVEFAAKNAPWRFDEDVFVKSFALVWAQYASFTDAPTKIPGYELWVNIFAEIVGYIIPVYYPEKAEENTYIKVLFDGCWVKGYLLWEHGRPGLTDHIWAILAYEEFFQRDGFDIDIDDLINLPTL